MQHNRAELIKPGQIFKSLTVIEKVPGKLRRWLCKCSCGTVVTAYQTELLRNKKISCGCLRPTKLAYSKPEKETRGSKFVNLSGQKFGNLTAVEFVGLNNIKSSVWKFRCGCGSEIIRTGSQVSRGAISSCGCLKNETISHASTLPNKQAIKNTAYAIHKKTASQRGYTSELTKDAYIEIASLPCYYCGSMSERLSNNKRTSLKLNSVDRLNNEPYYSKINAVPACFECQRAKSAHSESGFLDLVKKIYEYRKLGE